MSAIFYNYLIAVCNFGTAITVAACNFGKRTVNVELCKQKRRFLNSVNVFRNLQSYFGKQLIFKCLYLVGSSEHLRFHVFQLFCYVSFAVCKRLFADKPIRNARGKRFRNLDIIAENAVVSDFKRFYSCGFFLCFFNAIYPTLAIRYYRTKVIYILVISVAYDTALTYRERRIVHYCRRNKRTDIFKRVKF